jgi:hypothetical protein
MSNRRKNRQPKVPEPPPPIPQLGKANSNSALIKWAVGIALSLATIFIGLYINRPEIEVKTVYIECAVCDSANDLHSSTSPEDTAATLNVVVEDTANVGTTLVHHNLTSICLDPTTQLTKDLLAERTDANDQIPVSIGAHQPVTLRYPISELFIFVSRHGSPQGSSLGPIVRNKLYVFGNAKYRAFLIPQRTDFCFEYFPPVRGLKESWAVCPVAVTNLITSQD